MLPLYQVYCHPILIYFQATIALTRCRQLERLFLKHLHSPPSRYYLKLRLDRARRLLKQTSRSIVEITSMCGFVSTTHFSRCYRKYMGVSPKGDRTQGVPEVYQIFESELPPEGAELAN